MENTAGKRRPKYLDTWLKSKKMMNCLKDDIFSTLREYKKSFPHEDVRSLLVFAESMPACTSRKNPDGHFTASGLVIHDGKVLLIFHNKLQRYLQPGGHVEADDESLFHAARREVEEETGLSVRAHRAFREQPIHIDVHTIPENKKKSEPEHLHYDCMFVFELAAAASDVRLQEEEVSGFQWVPMDHDFKDAGIAVAVEKIQSKLEKYTTLPSEQDF